MPFGKKVGQALKVGIRSGTQERVSSMGERTGSLQGQAEYSNARGVGEDGFDLGG